MPQLLTPEEIPAQLEKIPAWTYAAPFIERTVEFASYTDGLDFVNRVAGLAEELDHHPELTLSWRKVTVQLTTHSRGGLTDLDVGMARKIDALDR